nr:expressed conserved protein [Hymenolepis microstoma]
MISSSPPVHVIGRNDNRDRKRCSKVKGCFVQSGIDNKTQFLVAYSHDCSNLVIRLTEWTLDVECKIKDKAEALRYSCRQFPGPIVPGGAQYKITNGRVVLKLPKADPSQSWAGELTVKGLDQSS